MKKSYPILVMALSLIFLGCGPSTKTKNDSSDTGRATPSPRLRVLQADSPEEQEALNEAFLGVTNSGQVQTGLYSIKATGVPTTPIKNAVEIFLSSLSPEQKAICTFPIDSKEWRRWTNIDIGEYKRTGIGLPDLSDEQRKMAFQILQESLSPAGFKKTQDIMKMEGYLARLANDFEILGPDLYWFTFMGEPSDTEPWGWQFDGHHLIINYFILGDQVVMTPTFMGSEPNYIVDGEHAGTRTFEKEEALGIALYNALDESLKAKATLHDRKDYDYNQTESFRDNAVVPYSGVKVSAFSTAQLSMLETLIQEYIGNLREGHAQIRMEEILAHLDATYFSWIGAMDGSGPFYYRIQSPVVLIEFDHHRPVFLEGDKPTRKHVHTVVRTPNGNDYGKDLLKQHLERHPH